jgi:hypothetical protein
MSEKLTAVDATIIWETIWLFPNRGYQQEV